jgi:hypothetical protein
VENRAASTMSALTCLRCPNSEMHMQSCECLIHLRNDKYYEVRFDMKEALISNE